MNYRSPNNDGFLNINSNLQQIEKEKSMKDFYNISYNYRYPVFSNQFSCIYQRLFSPDTVKFVSSEITTRLEGVHPDNKQIVVPDRFILNTFDSFYTDGAYKDPDLIIRQTIMHYVNAIKTEYEMIKQNNKLNNWVVKYDGTFGIVPTNNIKLRLKGPTRSILNYNY